jgi:hypothetical protein
MGNRKAREMMLQKEQDALWERIRTEPRPAASDVYAYGIGIRRIQLIVWPSFEEAFVWDVREGPESWRLFRPNVLDSSIGLVVVGYDAVPIESNRLEVFFRRIIGLSMPIAPDLSSCGGADGTSYELAIFGDLHSSWRFQWWSQAPKHWRPLVEVASEMIVAFSKAEGLTTPELTEQS